MRLIPFLLLSLTWFSCISTLRQYQVQEFHLYSPDIPPAWEAYRIALISDIHIWDTQHRKSPAAAARQKHLDTLRMREVALILEQNPSQMLLLAGDYVSYRHVIRSEIDLIPYLQPFKDLDTYQYKIAVLGNHDHFMLPRDKTNPTIKALEAAEIQILVDETLRIPRENAPPMYIVGIDDFLYGKRQPGLLNNFTADDFIVALAHNPDSFNRLEHPERVDLALAGHLHGGQITFFGLAPVVRAQPKYLQQPFQGPYYPVFVSNGLGASGIQLRIMAPPQIWFITLHHGNKIETSGRVYKAKYPSQKYSLLQTSYTGKSRAHPL